MSEGFTEDEGYVEFNPDAEKRAYLKVAGKYGPGLEHPADCEVSAYEMPSTENPAYDTEGKRGPYAMLNIRVASEEFGLCFVRHFEPIGSFAGSRMPRWLGNLGVPMGPAPTYRHRPGDVIGHKCGVEVGDPRNSNDGRSFTGRLMDVFGAS